MFYVERHKSDNENCLLYKSDFFFVHLFHVFVALPGLLDCLRFISHILCDSDFILNNIHFRIIRFETMFWFCHLFSFALAFRSIHSYSTQNFSLLLFSFMFHLKREKKMNEIFMRCAHWPILPSVCLIFFYFISLEFRCYIFR